MTLSELKELVEQMEQQAVRQRLNLEDIQVVIASHKVGLIGGTPSTNIKYISLGFDWDKGKLIIYPEQTLKDKYEELGWSKYKIDKIVKENKKLKEQLNK